MSAMEPRIETAIAASDASVSAAERALRWHLPAEMASFVRGLRRCLADGSLLFGLIVLAIWMLSRPFQGVEGDARIYLAHALADLDPAGVGRDLMFVHDGQSQFSIFPLLADRLVAAFNPANASVIFAILNSVAWLAAAYVLVGRFAQGRMKWAILMVVAALPCFYGPYDLLRYGEQYAVPRPLAEACVLTALAFLIDERRGFALAFLALAVLFHPIMALPGLLVFAIDLCRADRRWIVLGLGLGLAVLAAAASHVPFFDRLTTVDQDWLNLLRIRTPYLFPTLSPIQSYTFLALQLATIAIAAGLLAPRARFIFAAVAGVGPGGILAAVLLGDLWPITLVVQAQLWRTAWLTCVFAGVSFAVCLLHFEKRGPRLELATAFLVLGWLFPDEPIITSLASCAALLLYGLSGLKFGLSRFLLNSVWAVILGIGLYVKLYMVRVFFNFLLTTPPDGHAPFMRLWDIYFLSVPIIIFALVWAKRENWLSNRILAAVAAAAVLGVLLFWDDRPSSRKFTDMAVHPADLTALFPADRSEIYWMGGVEPWYLLGHPSWLLRIQGAGIVFSRPLSMLWQDRVKALVGLDLADENILAPWTVPVRQDVIQLTRAPVDQLCARADAPSTIVAPLEEGMSPPADLKYQTWQPPAPQFRLTQKGEVVTWHRIENFVIVSCADHAL